MGGFKAIIILSLAFVVGLTFLVLSCVAFENSNWYPMFLIVFYLLSPFPLAIAKHFGNGSNGGTSPEIELALFVTSGIVMSAFCLPLVLAHALVITSTWATFFAILGSAIIFGTGLAYAVSSHDEIGSSII